MSEMSISVSPLTGCVYAGRLNKAGNAFTSYKKDVTSDFLRCVLEKAHYHGGTFEIRGSDGSLHTVTVSKALGEAK